MRRVDFLFGAQFSNKWTESLDVEAEWDSEGSQAFLLREITSGPLHLLFPYVEFPFPTCLRGSVLHSGLYSNVTSSESLSWLPLLEWHGYPSFLFFLFFLFFSTFQPQLTYYPFTDLSL